MSRSNDVEFSHNPASRWFEWAGGSDGGYVSWYDKDAKENVKCNLPFTFLLLDELSTVKGWHDPSESGIFANEVRDTRQDVLLVKSFKGGELASGLYPNIRDRIKAVGGKYHASCYIAYKDGSEMKLGNIGFKGAAVREWMEFKKTTGKKKNAEGKNVPAYYVDAICIDGFQDGKKGSIKYRTPTFSLKAVGVETNAQALALDAELQTFLGDYLKRTKTEQVEAPKPVAEDEFIDDPIPDFTDRDPVSDDDVPF